MKKRTAAQKRQAAKEAQNRFVQSQEDKGLVLKRYWVPEDRLTEVIDAINRITNK